MNRLDRRTLLGGALGLAGSTLLLPPMSSAQPGRGESPSTPETTTPHATDGVVDLGTTGGERSEAYAINDQGIVVGWSYNADEDPHGFVWDGTSMSELLTLGGTESEGNGINSSGLIVGSAISSDRSRYAVWFDGAEPVSMGTLGGSSSSALAVNDDGVICGYARNSNDEYRAFVFMDSTMEALQAFPATEGESRAVAINADGVIAGWCTNASSKTRPVTWTDGVIKDLAPSSPFEGAAAGINASGQVVGTALSQGGVQQAVLWQPDGQVVILQAEPDFASEATAINDAGIIIGHLIDADDRRYAVVWIDGVLVRLPTLGGPRSTAWAVNESGQVVGGSRTGPDGVDSSVTHATLWQGV